MRGLARSLLKAGAGPGGRPPPAQTLVFVGGEAQAKAALAGRLLGLQISQDPGDAEYGVSVLSSEGDGEPLEAMLVGSSPAFLRTAESLFSGLNPARAHLVVCADARRPGESLHQMKDWLLLFRRLYPFEARRGPKGGASASPANSAAGEARDEMFANGLASTTLLLGSAEILSSREPQLRSLVLGEMRAIGLCANAGVATWGEGESPQRLLKMLQRLIREARLADGSADPDAQHSQHSQHSQGLTPKARLLDELETPVVEEDAGRLFLPMGRDSAQSLKGSTAEEAFMRMDGAFAQSLRAQGGGERPLDSVDAYLAYVTDKTKCPDRDLDELLARAGR